jgi:hypothetical protein
MNRADGDGIGNPTTLTEIGDPRGIGVGARLIDSYLDAGGQAYTASAIRVLAHNSEAPNRIRVEGCTFERADLPQILLDPNVQSTFTWAIG